MGVANTSFKVEDYTFWFEQYQESYLYQERLLPKCFFAKLQLNFISTWREVLFFAKKKYFFLQKKVLLFAKKSTFFCKKKYLFLVIKTHFMPSNALLWEPQSHHQGRLSGLLSSPIKQMTPQTTRVPSPPSQWKKSTLPLLHLQKKVHWLIWIS